MERGRRFSRTVRLSVVIGIAVVLLLLVNARQTNAHKLVTSKYDYNKDVFPLLQKYCARCHVNGGPAPMSLMTYTDAVPWSISIRDELTAGRMPPWPVDTTSPPVKGGHPISARDIDMITEWATGGNPEGNLETKLPALTFNPQWKLGPPDLKIPMDLERTLAPGTLEDVYESSLPTGVAGTKWIKAADLMPGTPSIVRDAVISIENGPVLAMWQPASDTVAAPSGAAFRLEPGSRIHLRIHYRKHFDQEAVAVSDKSTIGLYFTEPPLSGHELQSFVIDSPKAPAGPGGASTLATFTGKLETAARIVALCPVLDRAYASLNVDATTPSGTHVPLLRLRGPRPQWLRRYWLQEAVELAPGSQITFTVEPLADYSNEPKVRKPVPLQLALDYVPH
jgi:hypothetical protein